MTEQSTLFQRRMLFQQSTEQLNLGFQQLNVKKIQKQQNTDELPSAQVKMSPLLKPGESPILYSPTLINKRKVNKGINSNGYQDLNSPYSNRKKSNEKSNSLFKPKLFILKQITTEVDASQQNQLGEQVYEKKYTFIKDYNIHEYNLRDFELIDCIIDIETQYIAYNRLKQFFCIIKYYRITEEKEQKIQNQIAILYTLTKISKCEYIVKLLCTKLYSIDKELGFDNEFANTEKRILLIIEMGDCNLNQIKSVRIKKNLPWVEEEIGYIIKCILKALSFLQEIGICHKDIQEKNIFHSEGVYKLGDFSHTSFIPKKKNDQAQEGYQQDLYQLTLMIIRLCLQENFNNENITQNILEGKITKLKNDYPNIHKVIQLMFDWSNNSNLDYKLLLTEISRIPIQHKKVNESQFSELIQLNFQQKRFQKQDYVTMQRIAEGYNKIQNYKKSNQIYKEISEYLQKGKQYEELVYILCKIIENLSLQTLDNDCLNYIARVKPYIDRLMLEDQEKAAYCQEQMAKAYYRLSDLENCINYLQKSLQSYVEKFGKEHSKCATIHFELFQCFLKQGYFYEANDEIDIAINHFARQLEREHPVVARLYIFKAELQAKQELKNEALQSFQKAREIIDEFFINDIAKRVFYMNREGQFCLSLGQNQKALDIYKSIMNQLELQENQEYDASILSYCYEYIADILLEFNDYSMSLHNYEKCLDIRDKYYYDGHPEKMRILNIIADLLLKQNTNKALEYYERLLQNFQKIYGRGSVPEDLNMLERIGNLYFDQKKYERALECFSMASELLLKFQNTAKRQIKVSSRPLITVEHQFMDKLKIFALRCSQIGEQEKCVQYFDKAEEFCKEKFGRDSLEYAYLLEDIATFYEEIGNVYKSLQLNRESLLTRKQYQQDKSLAELMNKIARNELVFGYIDAAAQNFENSLAIIQSVFDQNSLEVCEAIDEMSLLYFVQCNPKKLKDGLNVIIQTREKKLQKWNINLLNSLKRYIYMTLYLQLFKDFQQYIKLFNDIINNQLKDNIDDKSQQETLLIQLQFEGCLFSQKYQLNKAIEKFRESLQILSNLRNGLQYTLDDIWFLIQVAETYLKLYDLEQFQIVYSKIELNIQQKYGDRNVFTLELKILQCKYQRLKENYPHAHECIKHAKELCELFFGKETFKLFFILLLQGQILVELEEYSESSSCFEAAILILNQYQDEIGINSIFEAQINEEIGWLKFKTYQIQAGLDKIEKSKIIKVDVYDDQQLKHPQILYSLEKQVHIYILLGKYDKATRRLEHLLTQSKLFYGENHPFFARLLLPQAKLQLNLLRLNDCKATLENAQRIFETFFGKDTLLRYKYDILQGQLLIEKGDIDTALQLLVKTKSDYKSRYNENSLIISDIYSLLGDIYRMQSYEEKSFREYDKAEKIIEKIYGQHNHIACASLFYKKALLKFDRRAISESLDYATKSIQLDEKINVDNTLSAGGLQKARLYDLLAKIHLEMSQEEASKKFIVKALEIKKLLGDKNVEYQISLCINEDITHKNSNSKQITDMYQKLSYLIKEKYGINSYYYQLARNRYADLLYSRGYHDECLKIYDEIFNYLSKYINKEHIQIAHILLKQASIYNYKAQIPKLINQLNYANYLYKLHLGPENYFEGLIQYELALVQFKKNDIIECLKKLQNGYNIIVRYVGLVHKSLIPFIFLEVQCLMSLGKQDEAFNLIANTNREFVEILNHGGYYSTYIQEAYGIYYYHIKQYEKALDHFNMALLHREKFVANIHPDYNQLKKRLSDAQKLLDINNNVKENLNMADNIINNPINPNLMKRRSVQSLGFNLGNVNSQQQSVNMQKTIVSPFVKLGTFYKNQVLQTQSQFMSIPQKYQRVTMSLDQSHEQTKLILPPVIEKNKQVQQDNNVTALQQTKLVLIKNLDIPKGNKNQNNRISIRGKYITPINKIV